MLADAHAAGRLAFFGDHATLATAATFAASLTPLRKAEWVVYAKKPFGGPRAGRADGLSRERLGRFRVLRRVPGGT